MDADVRRMVAVEAHRRRSGRCARLVHSLGTGESFEVAPAADGFCDEATGWRARTEGANLLLPGGVVELVLDDGVAFRGFDRASGAHFTGRAGGGATVTVYDARGEFFQYAVVT